MLIAIYIILGAIVFLVLFLMSRALPKKDEQTFNASLLVEELERNRMLTRQGDVVFGYKLQLPPAYSLTADAYEHLTEVWRIALKDLPQGTIIMRTDRYDRVPFDASDMPGDSYIQSEEKKYAAQQTTTRDTSYLFVIFTGFRETRTSRSQNPFAAFQHKNFHREDAEYTMFTAAIESMYLQLDGSGMMEMLPLSEQEFKEYTHYFFNGYQSEYLTDVNATGNYIKAGDNFVGAVSIEHERQFPETLQSPIPGRQINVPVGLFEDLGVSLSVPHIYNQIITISGHDKEYEFLKKTLETFRKNQGFTEENQDQVRRLKEARAELSDDLDAMLVRGHTNIIFWGETVQQMKDYRTQITNYLKQARDFEPIVPSGIELRNIVYCSHPATVSCMDKESFYLVDLKHTVALLQNTGGHRSDQEGIYLSDPVNHLPQCYDLYDSRKKYVDSKNIAVIGRTGGGKSVLLEKVVEGFHNEPSAMYVDIIVDCGGSYDKAARLYKPEEVFIFRYDPKESLGLDPFAAVESADSERVEDICQMLWLIVKPGHDPESEERVSMRKVVMSFLRVSKEPSWPKFYEWVKEHHQRILAENEIRPAYFDVEQFIHNGSEWCQGGIYGNVFSLSETQTGSLQGKRLLIFELENIKGKPQLLSIIVHLIGIAIRTLVWEQTGRRGFIIYEEFAELMKIDIIFSAVLYQMQAIRKKGGAACIVLQNLDQLAGNAADKYANEGGAAKALMKNIETVIFLAGADPTGFDQYSPGFTIHDRACVLALKNNYTTPPMYSSFYIYRSKRSTLMTLSISPRTYLAFQTEGEVCNELGELYAETGSMAEAIEKYEYRHNTN